jgi:hypothetical protein
VRKKNDMKKRIMLFLIMSLLVLLTYNTGFSNDDGEVAIQASDPETAPDDACFAAWTFGYCTTDTLLYLDVYFWIDDGELYMEMRPENGNSGYLYRSHFIIIQNNLTTEGTGQLNVINIESGNELHGGFGGDGEVFVITDNKNEIDFNSSFTIKFNGQDRWYYLNFPTGETDMEMKDEYIECEDEDDSDDDSSNTNDNPLEDSSGGGGGGCFIQSLIEK